MSFINKFATDFTSKVVKKSVKIARDKLPENISCKDLGTKPCTKINYYKNLKNIHQKNYTKANQCCEDKKYELVKKYFNSTKNKLEDLLECLKEIYSFEKDKKKNPAFKLYLCGSSSKGDDNSKSFIEDYFPRDNSVGLTPTVSKVACGAAEVVPLFQVTNLARTMKSLQDKGIWIVGAAGEADSDLYKTDLKGPLAIAMGAEDKGLRRLTREGCDSIASIPMSGSVSSLNVSVASGICLFEAL